MNHFAETYARIRRTRRVLFSYCESLPPELYIRHIPKLGGHSMRNLHVHVAECYQWWLAEFPFDTKVAYADKSSYGDVAAVRKLFTRADRAVAAFAAKYDHAPHDAIACIARRRPQMRGTTFTAQWLFTHTTTHEFHHKGQIVLLGRYLGYPPPDTDLVED